jgi:hypothetical protein
VGPEVRRERGLSENNRAVLPARSPDLKLEMATATGFNCQWVCPENTRLGQSGGGRGTGVEPSPRNPQLPGVLKRIRAPFDWAARGNGVRRAQRDSRPTAPTEAGGGLPPHGGSRSSTRPMVGNPRAGRAAIVRHRASPWRPPNQIPSASDFRSSDESRLIKP